MLKTKSSSGISRAGVSRTGEVSRDRRKSRKRFFTVNLSSSDGKEGKKFALFGSFSKLPHRKSKENEEGDQKQAKRKRRNSLGFTKKDRVVAHEEIAKEEKQKEGEEAAPPKQRSWKSRQQTQQQDVKAVYDTIEKKHKEIEEKHGVEENSQTPRNTYTKTTRSKSLAGLPSSEKNSFSSEQILCESNSGGLKKSESCMPYENSQSEFNPNG